MNQKESIFSLAFNELDRKTRIKHKLNALNLPMAVMNRSKELYRARIGEKITVTGSLVSRNNRFFIELPPKELISFYPEVTQPLSLLASFDTKKIPSIGNLAAFTGTVQARYDRRSRIRKNSRIFGEKYLAIEDWEYDYSEVYAECPIDLKDILQMTREQFTPEPPLDMALLFSPISAPPIFNTMGGVSSILSGIDLTRTELTLIGKSLQNFIPPWHHQPTSRGFHIELYPELTPKVSSILQNRQNSHLEYSPLVTRIGQIDLDKERGFFHLDDPLVLTSHTISYDETYRECDEFRPEIQWSFMWAHLQLQGINQSQLPTSFDAQYNNWIDKMCGEFSFFKNLHILDPASLYSIKGRKGGIIRLAAAYSRINESPIDKSVITKTFEISRKLFADFDNIHGFKLLEYEKDPSSPFFGLSKSKKLRAFREAIFDLLLSHDYITQEQMKKEAEKLNLTQKQFDKVFNELVNKGDLYDSGGGKYRAINKK